MANITFTSPTLKKDVTVYAVAGDRGTLLSVAEKNGIKIPFDCRDGECGSCIIKVTHLGQKPKMAMNLTEKEKSVLKGAGKLTDADIQEAEVNDVPPPYRLACQYIVRDEEVLVSFTGDPGQAPG